MKTRASAEENEPKDSTTRPEATVEDVERDNTPDDLGMRAEAVVSQ